MRDIRINEPGAGQQIMQWAGGSNFRPEEDHSLSTHDGDRLLGGFVFTSYMGNAISVHDGSCDQRWLSRDLMWMVFHYAFKQLGCHKLVAPTQSDNYHALDLNLRAGFKLEAVIQDLVRPGVHLMVLTMIETDCRWLRIIPTTVVNNRGAKGHDNG